MTIDRAIDQGVSVSPAPRAKTHRRARRQRKSVVLTIVMVIFTIYSAVPLLWLIINATKDQASLFSSFGLWFGNGFDLFSNIAQTKSEDYWCAVWQRGEDHRDVIGPRDSVMAWARDQGASHYWTIDEATGHWVPLTISHT